MYWKRGGIRLFKSWTLVRLYWKRGGGGVGPKSVRTENGPTRDFPNGEFHFFLTVVTLVWGGGGDTTPPTMAYGHSHTSLIQGLRSAFGHAIYTSY